MQLDMERTLLQAPVEKELCELDITRTGWWSKWPCNWPHLHEHKLHTAPQVSHICRSPYRTIGHAVFTLEAAVSANLRSGQASP